MNYKYSVTLIILIILKDWNTFLDSLVLFWGGCSDSVAKRRQLDDNTLHAHSNFQPPVHFKTLIIQSFLDQF